MGVELEQAARAYRRLWYWLQASGGGGEASEIADGYETRLATAGSTLDAGTKSAIQTMLSAIYSNGGEVQSGWLFGSMPNHDITEQLNLIEGEPSMVPIGAQHADTALAEGLLHLRVDGDILHGWVTDDSSGLLETPATSDDRYSLFALGQCLGDTDTSVNWARQEKSVFFSGAESTAANHFTLNAKNTGGLNITEWGGGIAGATVAGDRDQSQLVDPACFWMVRDETGNLRWYHAGDGTAFADAAAGDFTAKFRLGSNHIGADSGDIGYAVILKVKGDLNDTQRTAIFNAIMTYWRTVGYPCHISGNSVTDASAVTNELASTDAWPRQFARWGFDYSLLCHRAANGGRRLTYHAPTGYVYPGDSDPDTASRPINNYTWLKARVWINDDNQNLTSYSSGQAWADWKDCHDAIAQHLIDNGSPDLITLISSQIAMAAWHIGDESNDFVYADFAAAPGRENLLTISKAIRDEAGWINPTWVADHYRWFNEGWPTGDDGTAEDPIEDKPKGIDTLFQLGTPSGRDPQHPTKAGHDLMFERYQLAFEDYLANPAAASAPAPFDPTPAAGSFSVTNSNDSGAGSFRQAVADMIANNGGTITFTVSKVDLILPVVIRDVDDWHIDGGTGVTIHGTLYIADCDHWLMEEIRGYSLWDYNTDSISIAGCNGFVVRRSTFAFANDENVQIAGGALSSTEDNVNGLFDRCMMPWGQNSGYGLICYKSQNIFLRECATGHNNTRPRFSGDCTAMVDACLFRDFNHNGTPASITNTHGTNKVDFINSLLSTDGPNGLVAAQNGAVDGVVHEYGTAPRFNDAGNQRGSATVEDANTDFRDNPVSGLESSGSKANLTRANLGTSSHDVVETLFWDNYDSNIVAPIYNAVNDAMSGVVGYDFRDQTLSAFSVGHIYVMKASGADNDTFHVSLLRDLSNGTFDWNCDLRLLNSNGTELWAATGVAAGTDLSTVGTGTRPASGSWSEGQTIDWGGTGILGGLPTNYLELEVTVDNGSGDDYLYRARTYWGAI